VTDYFSLVSENNTDESYSTFYLFSTIPKFKSLDPPQLRPGVSGEVYYGLNVDCKEYKYYHATKVLNLPTVKNFGELDEYINYAIEDLKVDPSDPPKAVDNGYSSVYSWITNGMIDNNACTIFVNLYYKYVHPLPNDPPVMANLQLQFSSQVNFYKAVPAARSVMIKVILDQYGSFPEHCN